MLASGAALLVTSFLPLWATYRIPGLGIVAPETVHLNAWSAYGFGMQLALLLATSAVAVTIFSTWRPDAELPHKDAALLSVCGATALLLLWQIVGGPEGASDPGFSGYRIARGILLYTGAALACAMTYGSYLIGRQSRGAAGG